MLGAGKSFTHGSRSESRLEEHSKTDDVNEPRFESIDAERSSTQNHYILSILFPSLQRYYFIRVVY